MSKALLILSTISMVFTSFDSIESGSIESSPYRQIAELKKTLDKKLSEIDLLNQSNSYQANMKKEAIPILEEKIKTLRSELDDQSQTSDQKLAEWVEKVENLAEQTNELNEQILPYDCISDIEDKMFEDAAKKVEILSQNEALIANIIDVVYSGSPENIALINNFGKSLTSANERMLIYKLLANELESTEIGERDDAVSEILQIINLIKSVRIEIRRASSTVSSSFGVKPFSVEGWSVVKKLRDLVKRMSVKLLEKAMRDAPTANAEVANISLALYSVDTDLYFNVISDAIDSVYDEIIDVKRISDFIDSYENITPTLDGYTALIYEIKYSNSDMHSDAVVDLAFRMKEILQQTNYGNVNGPVRSRFEKLRDVLPQSLSVLAFATHVCFKNVMYNEYLYAADFGFDSDRRYVFTWGPGNRVCQAGWEIHRSVNGHLSIQNLRHNEFLFSSNYKSIGDMLYLPRVIHKVYTWIPKNDIQENQWRIESSERGVRIWNMENKELLLKAHEDLYSENRRYVYAEKYDNYTDDEFWLVEECNNLGATNTLSLPNQEWRFEPIQSSFSV